MAQNRQWSDDAEKYQPVPHNIPVSETLTGNLFASYQSVEKGVWNFGGTQKTREI
jgi:hypothetical protein